MQNILCKLNAFKRSVYLFFLLFGAPLLAHEFPLPASAAEVSDPYRWLEDSKDSRTQEWVNEQEKVFKEYIRPNPFRAGIKRTLENLLSFESYSVPLPFGENLLFRKRLSSEDQAVLYVQEGLHGIPRPLINPNLLSFDCPVSLKDYAPSPDGKLLAYGLSESGSDWTTWKVLDISSGENRSDLIERTKFFAVAWSPDSLGFFYTRLDEDDFYRVYYHLLGTEQSGDDLIYENPEGREFIIEPFVSSNQKFLMINLSKGSGGSNAILYRDLNSHRQPFTPLVQMNGSSHIYVKNSGSTFYLWTNQEAPLGKVIALDPLKGTDAVIIPEEKCPLNQVVPVGKHFVVGYTENVMSRLALLDERGEMIRDIRLPGIGTVSLFDVTFQNSEYLEEIFFSFTHFVQPPVIYRYSIAKDLLEVFKEPALPFNPGDYETKQIFYPSKDGTKVPLFIVHKKGLQLDGQQETLLYAYGGFGVSLYPNYSTLNMAWLEQGGVFALANIRGGGELGKAWHEAGKRGNRQNCFDDFIAAAEYLIANGYTNPSKLAIRGASNGGLLTAVCLNQRPDLFGAAMVEVAVLDMLRFPLFTGGRFWMGEYGNPQDPEDFKVLYSYSPYHNVRSDGNYPPILITTGDHDDRVVPLHSYKYAAAMHEKLRENGTVLLRIDRHAGHGAGKTISQWIEEAADTLSFLKWELSKGSKGTMNDKTY